MNVFVVVEYVCLSVAVGYVLVSSVAQFGVYFPIVYFSSSITSPELYSIALFVILSLRFT